MAVLLETTMGDIVIDLYPEDRPRCCLNFLKLCKIKYYNFCLFHSVQRNFMAQSGDPTGTGKGGDSLFSKLYGDQARFFEMETSPRIKHTKKGAVSMVNNGDNMHGSQFFLTLAENVDYLDGKHTVFGEVSEGLDVLAQINEALVDKEHRPYQDIRISHTVILDDPFDDPAGLDIPDRSPEPTKDQLESGRIGADEKIDDTEGKTVEQVEEMTKTQEAQARAQILEMIGDLPDADVKPPDNVLFVCKLNPVTTSEDLEVIFSRFGAIESCEVIKDQKTGESLQYAFVEFEREEDCENAFFKMDNVLIDDRRIHVDFSQSVSKIQGKGPVDFPSSSADKRPKFELKDKSKKMGKQYDLILEDDDPKVPSHHASGSQKRQKRYSDHSPESSDGGRHSKSKAKHRKRRDSSSSSEDSDSEPRQQRRTTDKRRRRRSSSDDYDEPSGRDRQRTKRPDRREPDRRGERRGDQRRGEERRRDGRDDDRSRGGRDAHRDSDRGRGDREREERGGERDRRGGEHRRHEERHRGRERDADRDGDRSRSRHHDRR